MITATVEIRILPPQPLGYPIELTVNQQQQFSGGYIDPTTLALTGSVDEDGVQLFQWLFSHEATRLAWAEIRGQHPQRRIRLRLDAVTPELHALPWELLQDRSAGRLPQMVAADGDTPFSRYLAGQWPVNQPFATRPVKVLVAIANPSGLEKYNLAPIDLLTEQHILTEALRDVTSQVDFTFLHEHEPITLAAMGNALKEGYQLLHIVAHGLYNKRQQEAALLLADEANQLSLVSGTAFATQMADLKEKRPALVYLAVCQSATRSPADAFRGLAPQLIQAGVPAVLAMQDNVPIHTAHAFGQIFYRELFQHGQVDVASNQARAVLLRDKLPGSAIPVLFSRLVDNQLLAPPDPDSLPIIETQPFEPETVYIPAGAFIMGDKDRNAPPHTVTLGAYRIGLYPVTHAEYAEFVRQTGQDVPAVGTKRVWRSSLGLKPTPDQLDHPVVGVSWYEAQAYCRWLTEQTGRRYRLPSEAEWERAARGEDERLYPWGQAWTEGCCQVGQTAPKPSSRREISTRRGRQKSSDPQTVAVTHYPAGRSPFGCWDMVGNVWEWTNTLHQQGLHETEQIFTYPYVATDGREDGATHDHADQLILRGGSYEEASTEVRLTMRLPKNPSSTNMAWGFRVVMDVHP